MRTLKFFQELRGSFLKASCEAGSLRGWLGRAFCRESPIWRSRRPMVARCMVLPNRCSQIRTRSSRVNAKIPSFSGRVPPAPWRKAPPALRPPAAVGGRRPTDRAGRRGRTRCSGLPSRATSADPCRRLLSLPSGPCRGAHWQSPAGAAPTRTSSSALASLRSATGVRSLRISRADMVRPPNHRNKTNHAATLLRIAAAQQE